jgi:hypothetical protein
MATQHEIRLVGPLFASRDLMARHDRQISAALTELAALGQRLVVSRTPAGVSSGRGGLRGSVFHELRGVPAHRAAVVGTPLHYAAVVEQGRRPGRRPPVSALLLWVRRRLGVSAERAPSVAFLIARKIGRVGSAGHFMFARTRAQLEPIARQRFERLSSEIARGLGGR